MTQEKYILVFGPELNEGGTENNVFAFNSKDDMLQFLTETPDRPTHIFKSKEMVLILDVEEDGEEEKQDPQIQLPLDQ